MRLLSPIASAVLIAAACCPIAWAVQGTSAAEKPALAFIPKAPEHMSEELRSSIRTVVILPSESPAGEAVTGDYKNETRGFGVGMAQGSEIGKGIQTEVGGIPVGIPFPILTVPGALIGGISGLTEREIQEFRDALTEDLADASSQPLTNDAIASDVFWGLKRIPSLDPKIYALTTPIPEGIDAVLYVSLTDVTINVQKNEAIITTSANATLQKASTGINIFTTNVHYQDRDTLSNWNDNDHALWHDYINFAKHYIGREVSAQLFDRVELQHVLKPQKTRTVKQVKRDEWRGVSKTSTPELAWDLELLGGDFYGRWVAEINPADVLYDLEIYDSDRLVYAMTNIAGQSHTVGEELPRCKTYRWSVRPSYRVDGTVKMGEWMRSEGGSNTGNGGVGLAASVAPAYIYDYASLEIKCR